MANTYINILEEQNGNIVNNSKISSSRGKTMVLVMSAMFRLLKNNFKDIMLGRARLIVKKRDLKIPHLDIFLMKDYDRTTWEKIEKEIYR